MGSISGLVHALQVVRNRFYLEGLLFKALKRGFWKALWNDTNTENMDQGPCGCREVASNVKASTLRLCLPTLTHSHNGLFDVHAEPACAGDQKVSKMSARDSMPGPIN